MLDSRGEVTDLASYTTTPMSTAINHGLKSLDTQTNVSRQRHTNAELFAASTSPQSISNVGHPQIRLDDKMPISGTGFVKKAPNQKR